jgi:hypothetical protein
VFLNKKHKASPFLRRTGATANFIVSFCSSLFNYFQRKFFIVFTLIPIRRLKSRTGETTRSTKSYSITSAASSAAYRTQDGAVGLALQFFIRPLNTAPIYSAPLS